MLVYDAYVADEGILQLAILMNLHCTDELAQGDLIRFFAEAARSPTVLLSSQGARRAAVDKDRLASTLPTAHSRSP